MLLNLPHFSRFQWHAFSVCSGREDSTINFIVKNKGDFTRNFIHLFKEGHDINESLTTILRGEKKRKKRATIEPERKFSFGYPSFRRFRPTPSLKSFQINLSGPFGAPCQSAAYKEHVLLIGAGIGITPYLAYLRTLPPTMKYVNFVFICRQPELMRWISLSLQEQSHEIELRKRIKIFLFLTRRKEAHCLAAFLFWRAFLALKKKQELYGPNRDMLLDAPMSVSYERPDLKAILREAGSTVPRGKAVSVYSCAPHALNERLREICKEMSLEMLIRFDFYPEIFS